MAKFYQSILKRIPIGLVISRAYSTEMAERLTLEERLPECKCESCGKDEWIILPKESCAVREGGKPYIECMNCGYVTHL